METNKYKKYCRGGLSVVIPTNYTVSSHAPDFMAVHKKSQSTISISVNPKDYRDIEAHAKLPLPPEPIVMARIHRQGRTRIPYSGWERLAEHYELGFLHWVLLLTFYDKMYAHVEITSCGTFIEQEALWSKVVESIKIDITSVEGIREVSEIPCLHSGDSIEVLTEYGFIAIGPAKPTINPKTVFKQMAKERRCVSTPREVIIFGPEGADNCVVSFDNRRIKRRNVIERIKVVLEVGAKGLFLHDIRGPICDIELQMGKYEMTADVLKTTRAEKWKAVISFAALVYRPKSL